MLLVDFFAPYIHKYDVKVGIVTEVSIIGVSM